MSIYFSIVIPTYNRASFIEKTVRSLLEQNYDSFEVIVVDDGSKDDTAEVLDRITDKRLSYFKKENRERGAARNFGARLAKGKYVNFFDSDDLAYDHHLEAAFKVISDLGEPEVVHLGYDVKSPNGEVEKVVDNLPKQANKNLVSGNSLSCNGVFVRKDIALKYPFSEDRELSASEDYALWLKLSARFPIYCSPIVTSSIINHDARSVVSSDSEKIKLRLQLLKDEVFRDEVFVANFRSSMHIFAASIDIYLALHLAMMNKKISAVSYLIKAVRQYPLLLFQRKFAGVVKNIF